MRELADLPERLLEALRRAPRIREDEINSIASRFHKTDDDLTDRERDVLRCLSHGMTAQMTADALGVSYQTIKQQIKTARYRLRAKNQVHAVAQALRKGLIN